MNKLIIYGGLALGAGYFLKRKVGNTLSVANNLEVSIESFKHLKLQNNGVQFQIDARIYNPTDIDLSVQSGGLLKLKQIDFYDQSGQPLGQSFPSVDSVEILAKSGIVLAGIPVTIPYADLGGAIEAAMQPANLNYKLHFEALGKTFTIDA